MDAPVFFFRNYLFREANSLFSNSSQVTSKCGDYYNILTSSVIYYRTDPEQHGIIQYILTWNLFINQTLSVQRSEHLKF